MPENPEVPLPHVVALSWGVALQPQRGPKRELSIERIVETAIEIADAEGLAAVSMSRVATSLGYTTMSLYRYVTSKDDLLLLMQDAAGEVAVPAEVANTNWRTELRQWVLFYVGIYRRHPWFGDIPISGVPVMPNSLAFLDWGLRSLRTLPLGEQEKMAIILLATSYARAHGTLERDLAHVNDGQNAPPDLDGALREFVTAERYPNLRPLVESGTYSTSPVADDFDDFAFGLERMLDGIQHFVEHGERIQTTTEVDEARRLADLYSRDKAVREAAKARKEAETKVRELAKREREAIARAHERAKRDAERAAAQAAKGS
jgi:AcrR family transcriptional regulator